MFANRNYTKTENHLEEYRTERAKAAWERQQRNINAGLHPNDPRYVNENPEEVQEKP
jgi:hypothetical protein